MFFELIKNKYINIKTKQQLYMNTKNISVCKSQIYKYNNNKKYK